MTLWRPNVRFFLMVIKMYTHLGIVDIFTFLMVDFAYIYIYICMYVCVCVCCDFTHSRIMDEALGLGFGSFRVYSCRVCIGFR